MTLLRLALGNLRRDALGAAFVTAAIALGAGSLFFFAGLGAGLSNAVARLFPEADRTVEVVPPRLRLGGLFGGRLDEAAVARLRALPGVTEARRRLLFGAPASAVYDGSFFGARLDVAIEVAAEGVERGALAAELPRDEPFSAAAGSPVPACVSSRLLDLYDGVFAPTRGLPRLTAGMLLGFTAPITLGRSLVAASRGPVETVPVRIACVSPRAMLAGLTVPLEVARAWNLRQGLPGDGYTGVSLSVASPRELPAVEAAVRSLGFELNSGDREAAQAAGRAAAVGATAFELLALLLVVLATGGVFQLFSGAVRSRRREIGILRALGATPAQASGLLLLEAAILGGAGGALGLCGALGAASLADAWLRRLPFPGRPETIFAFGTASAAAALAVGLLAALGGAYLPARLAARLDPARTLSDG